MNKLLCILLLAFGLSPLAQAETEADPTPSATTQVKLATSLGDILIELDADKAPLTVENFVNYVNAGFYDGVIFHRVINGFMIQGGGFTPDMARKSTQEPIRNESDNGLSNRIGTIAMARTNMPHSATAQFFINVADNTNLDYADGRWGYAVFGKVIEGMDVVDRIKQLPTTNRNGYRNVPAEPVIITKASVQP